MKKNYLEMTKDTYYEDAKELIGIIQDFMYISRDLGFIEWQNKQTKDFSSYINNEALPELEEMKGDCKPYFLNEGIFTIFKQVCFTAYLMRSNKPQPTLTSVEYFDYLQYIIKSIYNFIQVSQDLGYATKEEGLRSERAIKIKQYIDDEGIPEIEKWLDIDEGHYRAMTNERIFTIFQEACSVGCFC